MLNGFEIKSLIEEGGGAEMRCHFCGEVYNFTADELAELLEEMNK